MHLNENECWGCFLGETVGGVARMSKQRRGRCFECFDLNIFMKILYSETCILGKNEKEKYRHRRIDQIIEILSI